MEKSPKNSTFWKWVIVNSRKYSGVISTLGIFLAFVSLIGLNHVIHEYFRASDLLSAKGLLYGVMVFLVLLTAWVYISYTHNKLRETNEKMRSTHAEMRTRMARRMREVVKRHARAKNYISWSDPSNCDVIHRAVHGILVEIMSKLAESLSDHTEDQCHACAKIILPNPEENDRSKHKVRSIIRDDNEGRRWRNKQIRPYCVDENTALLEVYMKGGIFVNNDLSSHEGYKNNTNDWRNYYNATIVVPIRNIDVENDEIIVGFLCADNIKGGFSKDTSRYIMESYATLILDIIQEVQEKLLDGQPYHNHYRSTKGM